MTGITNDHYIYRLYMPVLQYFLNMLGIVCDPSVLFTSTPCLYLIVVGMFLIPSLYIRSSLFVTSNTPTRIFSNFAAQFSIISLARTHVLDQLTPNRTTTLGTDLIKLAKFASVTTVVCSLPPKSLPATFSNSSSHMPWIPHPMPLLWVGRKRLHLSFFFFSVVLCSSFFR